MRTLLRCGLTLLLVLLAAPLWGQDSTIVQQVPEIPTSLADFFTQYQMVLTVGLGSLIVYGLATLEWFRDLGDWTKRAALVLAAIAVSFLLKLVGGTMSADLAGLISGALGGLAAAVTGASVFAMGKTQPGNDD